MKKKPFIEENIEAIKKWQVAHEKKDRADFKAIHKSLAGLPDTVAMAKAVADSVQTTVNGKIDKIAAHLTEQDVNLAALSKKIKPFDQTRTWLREAANIVLYIGGLAIAIGGIIELLRLMIIL